MLKTSSYVLFLSLSLAVGLKAASTAQSNQVLPAFTLHSRITFNNFDGSKSITEETRYVSSNGSYRVVQTSQDGKIREQVYVAGQGHFIVDHQRKVLIQDLTQPVDNTDPPVSSNQLQQNPSFMRTEKILGITAYVHRNVNPGYGKPVDEVYYAPELGKAPIKRVHYFKGKIFRISEPLRISFGEPDASLIKAPTYPVVEGPSVNAGVLNKKATKRVQPAYPQEAKAARASGTVTVQILVDKEGKVERAEAVNGHPLLQQSAVEAAYKARFSPTMLNGKPVKATGVITYEFVLQ